MRLRACISGLLLAPIACAGLPQSVRIDVDGHVIELRQQGLSGTLVGGWSTSPSCGPEPRFDVQELGASVAGIRAIAADELEVIGADGTTVRLYRCR